MIKLFVVLILVLDCALAQYDRRPPPPPDGGFQRPPPPPDGGFQRPPPPDGGFGSSYDRGFGSSYDRGFQPPPPPEDRYPQSSYDRFGERPYDRWSQSDRGYDRGYPPSSPGRYPRSVGSRGGMFPPPSVGTDSLSASDDERLPQLHRRQRRFPSELAGRNRRSPKMQYDSYPPPPPDGRFRPPPPPGSPDGMFPPSPNDRWSQPPGRLGFCRITFLNRGAYTLQVNQEAEEHRTNDLLIGQSGTFDINPNVPLRLKAVLGQQKHCYPAGYCGGVITCTGTTLIGFDCDC